LYYELFELNGSRTYRRFLCWFLDVQYPGANSEGHYEDGEKMIKITTAEPILELSLKHTEDLNKKSILCFSIHRTLLKLINSLIQLCEFQEGNYV
jgi:hypothetical protein